MLINAQKTHTLDQNSDLYPAANRLLMAKSGKSHDINAADVYDHKSCYSQFIYFARKKNPEENIDETEKRENVISLFNNLIKIKVLKELSILSSVRN